MNVKNCFIAGPPVYGDDFFGRDELMRRLKHSIENNMSVVLIGQRRIGKSSILNQVNYLIEGKSWYEPKPIIIRMDGFHFPPDERKHNTLAIKLIEEIVRRLLRWAEDKPANIQKIFKDINYRGNPYDLLTDCLWRIREEDFQLVILFDEIDCAILDGSPKTAGVLRGIAQSGHVAALVTSYRDVFRLKVEETFVSPWWNVFQIIRIGLFTDEEAIELLSTQSQRSGKKFTRAEVLFLKDVLGNFPYFLQLAGSFIFSQTTFNIEVQHCGLRLRGVF